MKQSTNSHENPRRRGRPRKQDPGTGSYPEHAFAPSRATEIESFPLPDFPLAHDVQTSRQNTKKEQINAYRVRNYATQVSKKERIQQDRRKKNLPGTASEQDEKEEQKEKETSKGLQGWISEIQEFGNTMAENGRERFQCISVIGQIEGHSFLPEGQKATKYEHIIPMLVSCEEDDSVDGLLVILNTMGGDVEAGLAIAEMIASMTKPTVSLVLGGGHSIGVPLACAAKYSLIVPSATMTIHPVRVSGMVIGVPQSFRYMSDMQERTTKFICAHSKADHDTLRDLMMRPDQIATDCGSILEGDEAVQYGIIDEVGGLDRALEVLRGMVRKRKCPVKNKKKN